jgi:hypothetical protein
MNNDSREVVSSFDPNKNVCVGLLVTEDEFNALKHFDGRKAVVTGLFEKNGCGGLTICHDSCGPYAIAHPRIAER